VVVATLVGWGARKGDFMAFPSRATALVIILVASFALTFSSPCHSQEAARSVAGSKPPPLASHVMTYHAKLQQVVMFGGSDPDRTPSGTLWGWDGSRWNVLSDDGPEARLHTAIAYDSRRDRLVLFGGIKDRETSFGDTWEWNGETWREVATGDNGPGIRDHHAMVYDEARGVTVLFAGQDDEHDYRGDTWTWNGSKWSQVATDGPPARSTHRLVYDDHSQRVIVSCGWGSDTQFGDTWAWDGTTWTELAGEGPAARGATRLAYDAKRSLVVLFGGYVGDAADGQSWLRSAAGWTEADVTGPPARNVHGMAYDAARDRVVLYGGIGADGRLADTWEWDGTSWVEMTPNSAPHSQE
jgi:hypothetical protein